MLNSFLNLAKSFYLLSSMMPFSQYIAHIIKNNNNKVIAVCGPSCGGKTTTAHQIQQTLGNDKALLISVDDYWCYNRLEMKKKNLTGYDWQARDKTRFLHDLELLKNKIAIEKPLQDYEHEKPSINTEHIVPKDIIILQATLDFSDIATNNFYLRSR